MRGSTHLFTGLAAASLLTNDYLSLGVAALGALMPDIDHPDSIISQRITHLPVHGRIGRGIIGAILVGAWYQTGLTLLLVTGVVFLTLAVIPHRGITHSLLGMIVSAVAIKALGWPYLYFLVGYSMHLVEDALTPSGIPLFYPWQERIRIPLIKTESIIDWLLGFAGAVVFILKMI